MNLREKKFAEKQRNNFNGDEFLLLEQQICPSIQIIDLTNDMSLMDEFDDRESNLKSRTKEHQDWRKCE